MVTLFAVVLTRVTREPDAGGDPTCHRRSRVGDADADAHPLTAHQARALRQQPWGEGCHGRQRRRDRGTLWDDHVRCRRCGRRACDVGRRGGELTWHPRGEPGHNAAGGGNLDGARSPASGRAHGMRRDGAPRQGRYRYARADSTSAVATGAAGVLTRPMVNMELPRTLSFSEEVRRVPSPKSTVVPWRYQVTMAPPSGAGSIFAPPNHPATIGEAARAVSLGIAAAGGCGLPYGGSS